MFKKTVRSLLTVFFIYMLCFMVGCGNHQQKTLFSGLTMGTSYHITLIQKLSTKEKRQIGQRIETELVKINNLMSSYKSTSELMRFNNIKENQKFQLAKETFEVLEISKKIYTLSDGALNIAVSPLIELWGFGMQKTSAYRPSDQVIETMLKTTELKNLSLGIEPDCLETHTDNSNFKQPSKQPHEGTNITRAHKQASSQSCFYAKKYVGELTLNVSAVAKGYAVDQLAKLFKQELGYQNFLIEIGGEVYAAGQKADGSSWRLGLEKPDAQHGTVQVALDLKNRAVATSGDYRNYFEQDGVRYSHTINPTTGYPITHGLASVSVVSDSAADADAWATALNVLGPEKGYAKAIEQNLAVYFIERTKGQFVVRYTPQFETFIAQ